MVFGMSTHHFLEMAEALRSGAKHPELIDPMNDAKRSGFNPMSIPFVDNGLSIVTAENADDFYWDKYLKRRGTKGIDE